MTITDILRWLLLIGFIAQIGGIVYGVVLLARIKREQQVLADILQTFSDRSAEIATAIGHLRDPK